MVLCGKYTTLYKLYKKCRDGLHPLAAVRPHHTPYIFTIFSNTSNVALDLLSV